MDSLLTSFQALLGAEKVLTEREDLIPYSFVGTAVLRKLPQAVVFVRYPEEIAAISRLSQPRGLAVVTLGNGMGLSGGSVPVEKSVVLCTVKMDRILEHDAENLTLLVETGAITQKLFETADGRLSPGHII